MPTRRDFLSRLYRAGLAAPGFLMLPRPARPGPATPVANLAFGLFFDRATLPVLRDRFARDPLFASLRERLAAFDRVAERQFIANEVRYNDHLIHIRRLHETAREMAFYYVMTGDEAAADLSASAVRTIMQFPRWDYFLEAGAHVIGLQRAPGATIAVALAADWLGDFVDAAERAAWLRTMGERGCEASFRSLYGMRYKDRVVGWTMDPTSTYLEHRPGDIIDLSNWPTILDRTNLKAVPASALAVGAVTYRRQFGPNPEAERWLEQAVYSVGSFRDLYARDGSYDENISYANYTSGHLAQAMAVLEKFEGIDLYDLINWPGFADFALEMTMPTAADPYAIVNFGDAGTGMMSSVPFWIARRSHDRRAQWLGKHLTRGHDEWSVIWYEAEMEAAAPPSRPHLWRSDLDWIVARTGYGADDLVVAMRSGKPANHEHADRGSLIVKCFGETLVADPYRPPYSYTDPAWMMRTTAGHSALLIDGQGHQYHDGAEGTNASDAEARLVRTGERDGFLFWTSDATPAYRLVLPDVASVTRTVVVLHALPAVLILDKVLKRAERSHLQARFFAYNLDGDGRIEAAAAHFVTHRPGVLLHGLAHAPGGARSRAGVLPIPEETAQQHPFAEAATQEARLAPLLITVLAPERGTAGRVSARIRDLSRGVYEVTVRHPDHEAHCRIVDTGAIPEFEILR